MKNIEVVCALIESENKILCCRRGPGRDLEGFLEFPGGKMEIGETIDDAIIREIKKELLIGIKPIKHLITIEHDYPAFHLTMHAILSEIAEGSISLTEHTEIKWLSIQEMNEEEFAPADRKIVSFIKDKI